jgi:hypothetical protein
MSSALCLSGRGGAGKFTPDANVCARTITFRPCTCCCSYYVEDTSYLPKSHRCRRPKSHSRSFSEIFIIAGEASDPSAWAAYTSCATKSAPSFVPKPCLKCFLHIVLTIAYHIGNYKKCPHLPRNGYNLEYDSVQLQLAICYFFGLNKSGITSMHIQINELEQRIERVEDTRQELSLPVDINRISFNASPGYQYCGYVE